MRILILGANGMLGHKLWQCFNGQFETLECGSNMLSGAKLETILGCVRAVLDQQHDWTVPPEYLVSHVSHTVAKIVLGFQK